jgi:hypothetical protein
VRNTFAASRPRPRASTPLCSALAVTAFAFAFAFVPRAWSATTTPATTTKPPAVATLEECTTAQQQAERAATFSGEMTLVPGTARMEMRIDVLERDPNATTFHTVAAPGLGVWRVAAPGVKTFRYLKQVTNLAAPAFYRASVRFRWLNAKGRLIRTDELLTQRCLQTDPVQEEPVTTGPAPGS